MRNSPHFILYTIFLMVGMASARTRELSFQIMDGASKTPLVNTEISISPCGCGGISDDRGRFSIELPEADYRITIAYLGFGTEVREVQLNKDTFLGNRTFRKAGSPLRGYT
ncbi:carboxypeptidase-like regulatory domain-containing protein [Maribacter litopenaei]|uniref:Carboxypeptidase-like regulatory domain-containing protein n=1 Tax=Maribacter litopenaei TaxID=2976127 RepID=A0ABY5YAF3_9FLAO|nr:carboxypeptidase-like regulatory domain-containing protein [Maribacter litopenaei]UWX55199.1 carboxypeptidase-like regulatory domain-containing protein [Maribacter litopenaei]